MNSRLIHRALLLLFVVTQLFAVPVYARQAIASAHPLATKAGMQVLRDGGNAFDAAVTIAAMLAVVEPYGSGIGGGGFWLLHRASDNKQVMIDGRERAPLKADRDMYIGSKGDAQPLLSINGAMSAAIPGQVAAMVHLNQRYGKLSLKRLLQPAIDVATSGFEVDDKYRLMAQLRHRALAQSDESARIFLYKSKVPQPGHKIVQSDLAKVLQRIASKGHDGFYRGKTASLLVDGVRDAGGLWTLKDLEQYQVVERQPVQWQWQGMTITSAALPSSGGIVLAQIFRQLDLMDWSRLDESKKRHVLVEAMRRAYRDRSEYLGDSDYIEVPVKRLISKDHAKQLVENISQDWATSSHDLKRASFKQWEGQDTTHYAIIDKEGNRVSATLSINYAFGSGFTPPGTGVLLNDEMDDFSISPGTPNVYGLIGGRANEIEPGKRMLSSMSPTFVESKDKLAIVGTPGGSRIITMVLLGILSLHEGLDARTIVARPRLHHQYLPDRIQWEPGALTPSQIDDLERYGHQLQALNRRYGNMQLIIKHKQSGELEAASDPRGIGLGLVE